MNQFLSNQLTNNHPQSCIFKESHERIIARTHGCAQHLKLVWTATCWEIYCCRTTPRKHRQAKTSCGIFAQVQACPVEWVGCDGFPSFRRNGRQLHSWPCSRLVHRPDKDRCSVSIRASFEIQPAVKVRKVVERTSSLQFILRQCCSRH